MARKLLILLGALAFALALPAAAQADTFCVEAQQCEGPRPGTLQDALNDAEKPEFPGADRIEVGPGKYVGPFTAGADNPVEIVGVGEGETVLTAEGPTATVIALTAPDSILRGVTVPLGAADGMTGISAPSATDVVIEGAGTGATGFAGRSLTRAVVDLGAGATGARLNGSGALLDNVSIRAAGTGVQVAADASATLRHVTFAGGAAGGTGLDVATGGAATMSSSLITGYATAIRTDAQCPAPCVATDHSAYVPAPDAGVVTPVTPPVSDDPRLRDDLRPRFDSPLVDAANPAAGGETDASGAPREVDGNGDRQVRSDIGALEYQRSAPVISGAAAVPAKALAGVPIEFRATASDPDGEEVSAAWTFSDGATATGLKVTHTFAAPGPASTQLRVTDAAGVAETTSVAVTIDPAPVNVEPSAAGPPATVTRRSVIARVLPASVKLRAVARRDRRAPYWFKLRGRVVLPEGISAAGCAGGAVQLAIRAGKRRMMRSAKLAANCSFRRTLKLGRKRARRVVVKPQFGGTGALAPLDGAKLRLRAG